MEEEKELPRSFLVFYVKLPCAIALHFCLYPEVAKGMNLMKFANNQCDQFVEYGSEVSFGVGFIQVFTALLAEYINIKLLISQTKVELCIIHFVALEVIMEIAALYFKSLMNFKLKAILHENRPKCLHRSCHIELKKRSYFHIFARVFYKIIRAIYVSVIFYYVPFMVVIGEWSKGWGLNGDNDREVAESGGAGEEEGKTENATETSKMVAQFMRTYIFTR